MFSFCSSFLPLSGSDGHLEIGENGKGLMKVRRGRGAGSYDRGVQQGGDTVSTADRLCLLK